MKKLVLSIFIVAGACSVSLARDVWKSTNSLSNVNFSVLCSTNTVNRVIFHGVCTSFGVASASMTVYGSTWTTTASQTISDISLFVADQCKYYDTIFPNGAAFRKSNAAVATILYDCY